LYKGINDFKKSNQPRTNIVQDEKGVLDADPHRIMARWRDHFSQLLNIHRVNYVRHTEIQTAEPLVPNASACEVEVSFEEIKRQKSPYIDHFTAEFIKAGSRTIHAEVHKLINSIWYKEELPDQWKE
jgi:hypothetical protein